MTSNRHWHQRLYGDPDEGRIHTSREELVMWTLHRLNDAIEFGTFLYRDLIERCEEPFDGTFEWFERAFDNDWIERPRRGGWPTVFVKQALTVVNGHTEARFNEWLSTKKGNRGISFQSYVRWLLDSHNTQWAPTLRQSDSHRLAMIRSHRSSVR